MNKDFFQQRKPLLEILLILVVIMGSLTWYSFSGYPVVFDFELRKPSFDKMFEREVADSTLLAKNNSDSSQYINGVLDTMQGGPTKANKERLDAFATGKRDSSSHYILLTGDSMSEGLMFAFKKYAKFNGHKLKTRIWYSSSTKAWSKSDTLASFIKRYRPTFIIFTLGSNELFKRNISEREKYIKDIIHEADTTGIPFVWIGPPNWKDDTGINDLIVKNVSKDRFFESKNLKFKRKSDGAHPTKKASAIWADTISSWLTQTSRYRGQILFRDPKKHEDIAAKEYIAQNDENVAGRNGTEWLKVGVTEEEKRLALAEKAAKEKAKRDAAAAQNSPKTDTSATTTVNNNTQDSSKNNTNSTTTKDSSKTSSNSSSTTTKKDTFTNTITNQDSIKID
ncbi:MAG: SGNH/GDSL hydrolase family protein [Aureispira sp.]|nr:SGNH/GDSL hydrolase family protein [Aureispira sp.]